jgi:hypothetical protein
VDPDEPVVMASVYKLPLLVAFCRRVDAGDLDAREQVTVDPAGRTTGPTGLSVMRDPVTMSWRDPRGEAPAGTDARRLLVAATAPRYHELLLLGGTVDDAIAARCATDAARAAAAGIYG